MGYESKIYIVERYDMIYGQKKEHDILGRIIASFDLSCMADDNFCNSINSRKDTGISELFTKEIDFDLFVPEEVDGEYHESRRKDEYGDVCRYTSVKDLYWYLVEKGDKTYRRIHPLMALLKSFYDNPDAWINEREDEPNRQVSLVAVHFGH